MARFTNFDEQINKLLLDIIKHIFHTVSLNIMFIHPRLMIFNSAGRSRINQAFQVLFSKKKILNNIIYGFLFIVFLG